TSRSASRSSAAARPARRAKLTRVVTSATMATTISSSSNVNPRTASAAERGGTDPAVGPPQGGISPLGRLRTAAPALPAQGWTGRRRIDSGDAAACKARPASAAERGGTDPAAGPPQGGISPLGGQRPASAAERGGTDP